MLISILYSISIFKQAKEKEKVKIITEHQQYQNFLTEELNRRQHEYKNEINAILSIAEQKNGDDSIDTIIRYCEQIFHRKLKDDKICVASDNTIVAALIYRFCKQAQQSGIEFGYYLEEPFPAYPISEYELIEVLSNLLSNAFESVEDLENPMVMIRLEHKKIEVMNAVSNIFEKDNILRFGKKHSTKGAGHGYGLQNVFNITGRNEIDTDIFLEEATLHFILKFVK